MNLFAKTTYQSPFVMGLNAAREGIPWTACPFMGENQDYERSEWIRGHSSWSLYK